MKKYLLIMHGDIEPELKGPFDDELERSLAALSHRANDPNKEDGLFRIDCQGPIIIEPYSGGFFTDVEENETNQIVHLEFYDSGNKKPNDVYLGIDSEEIEKNIREAKKKGLEVRKIIHNIG